MPSLRQRIAGFSRGLSAPTDSDVVHMRTLRMAIGGIALGLPLVLVVGENVRGWLLGAGTAALIQPTISDYFHTGMREVFVGSLCAIAIFLLCYKGYERRDELAANVAGVAVLAVALFPTVERTAGSRSVTLFSDGPTRDPALVGWVHWIAAAVFFATLAVMSLFLFTRTDQPRPTPQKARRNRVYVACGLVILACIVAIPVGLLLTDAETERRTSFVFWLESLAVFAFGISWLTKAEVILPDRPTGAILPPLRGLRGRDPSAKSPA